LGGGKGNRGMQKKGARRKGEKKKKRVNLSLCEKRRGELKIGKSLGRYHREEKNKTIPERGRKGNSRKKRKKKIRSRVSSLIRGRGGKKRGNIPTCSLPKKEKRKWTRKRPENAKRKKKGLAPTSSAKGGKKRQDRKGGKRAKFELDLFSPRGKKNLFSVLSGMEKEGKVLGKRKRFPRGGKKKKKMQSEREDGGVRGGGGEILPIRCVQGGGREKLV